jgi:hypothetical protein
LRDLNEVVQYSLTHTTRLDVVEQVLLNLALLFFNLMLTPILSQKWQDNSAALLLRNHFDRLLTIVRHECVLARVRLKYLFGVKSLFYLSPAYFFLLLLRNSKRF